MKNEEFATAYMKKLCAFAFLCSIITLAACSTEDELREEQKGGVLRLTTSVNGFDGPVTTRTDMAGTAFATGDWMKLKIICPYSTGVEFGETTYGHTADGMWLFKWENNDWARIMAADGIDVEGAYEPDHSYDLFGVHEAQQTPYVYTASTWNENVRFIAPNNPGGTARYYYSQYSYTFRANQQQQADYLKCDLLWAQTYMQTGSYDVHLSFNHVMACLKISVTGATLSSKAVLTLEGMPDIDQREVVVGDYYAEKAENLTHKGTGSGNVHDYSYYAKCRCAKADNGKVLGVAVIDDSQAKAVVYPMTGNPNPNNLATIANTGVYTAYHAGDGTYYIIVPPCTLPTKAKIWIRDGEKRYSYELDRQTFEQGKQYPVTIDGLNT